MRICPDEVLRLRRGSKRSREGRPQRRLRKKVPHAVTGGCDRRLKEEVRQRRRERRSLAAAAAAAAATAATAAAAAGVVAVAMAVAVVVVAGGPGATLKNMFCLLGLQGAPCEDGTFLARRGVRGLLRPGAALPGSQPLNEPSQKQTLVPFPRPPAKKGLIVTQRHPDGPQHARATSDLHRRSCRTSSARPAFGQSLGLGT